MKVLPQKLDRMAKGLIPRFRAQRIGVVGDLMLDRYLWGTATRLSPEAAVPVVDFVEQSECLGGAGMLRGPREHVLDQRRQERNGRRDHGQVGVLEHLAQRADLVDGPALVCERDRGLVGVVAR